MELWADVVWWGTVKPRSQSNSEKIGEKTNLSVVEWCLVAYLLHSPETWVGAHWFGIPWGAIDLRIRSWNWFLNRWNRVADKNARLTNTSSN